ncbi:MAG: tetratricopeptide repeat protein [bacterium]
MAQATLAATIQNSAEPEAASSVACTADSLAGLLCCDEERMLVQLRLTNFNFLDRGFQDSILAIMAKKKPSHPIVLSTQALRLTIDLEYEQAAVVWRQLIAVNPNHAQAYNWLGYNAANRGQYEDAATLLHKYAYLAPGIANPHDSLGEVLTFTGKYAEAAQEFRKALEIQPDFFVSILNLAQVYVQQGKLKKGLKLLHQVREQFEGTNYARLVDYQLVRIYYTMGLTDKFRTAITEFVHKYPEDLTSRFYNSLILAQAGLTEQAEAVCDSFVLAIHEEGGAKGDGVIQQSIRRRELQAKATLAECLGRHEQAADSWRQVLEVLEQFPPHHQFGARYRLGINLARINSHQEVLEQAREILAINPNLITVLALQTESALALRELETARDSYGHLESILVGADPDLPLRAHVDSLGQVLVRLAFPPPQ